MEGSMIYIYSSIMWRMIWHVYITSLTINTRQIWPSLQKKDICVSYWKLPGQEELETDQVFFSEHRSICSNILFHLATYLIFVIFFTQAKFLENKIYTEKTRKLRQNTQKIAIFLRYYGKIHSKLTIFRVKSVKIYTRQKKFTREYSWLSWQIWGMGLNCNIF